MKRSKALASIEAGQQPSFDLVRLTQAAKIVNVSADSLRSMFKRGLRGYRHGRMVFVSLKETESFIRDKAEKNPTLIGITKPRAA